MSSLLTGVLCSQVVSLLTNILSRHYEFQAAPLSPLYCSAAQCDAEPQALCPAG